MSWLTLYGIRKKSKPENKNTPFVSIIVAAKDEELFIEKCLNSLKSIKYPSNKIEYILINDRSTDKTRFLMKQFTDLMENSRIIDIKILPKNRTGKINALIKGTEAAKGDIFLFTDADCEVPEDWVDSFIKHIDSGTGMAGGFIVLDRKHEKSPLFHYLQSIDWIFLTSIGHGWANLGKPLSIFGNNFAIKKYIYEKCGGFESIENHITEDYALMKNVLSKTEAKVNFVLSDKNTVYTNPVNKVRTFFHQRKRWALSSSKRGVLSILLSLISLLTRILIIITLISQMFLTGLIAMLLLTFLDTAILLYPMKKLKRLYLLKYIFLFEIYFTVYQIFFTPLALFAKKVLWKSDKYSLN